MSENLLKLLASGKIENLPTIIKEFRQYEKNNENKNQNNFNVDENYLIIFLLMNRVFSEEATGCQNIVLTENWQSSKIGGWMKEIIGFKNNSSNNNNNNRGNNTNQNKSQIIETPSVSGFSTTLLQREYGLSMDAIQLLSLFSAHPNADQSLLKMMSGIHRSNELSLTIFPKKIQWKYLLRPEYEFVQTANHQLFDDWYAGIRIDQVRDGYSEPIMTPDILIYYLISFLRYPTIENAFVQYSYGSSDNSNAEKASIDYFFPSSSHSRAKKYLTKDPEIALIKILTVYGCAGWLKSNPYLVLLNHYLEHFLPITLPTGTQSILQSQSLTQVSIGNLFLRLIIDFWIDTICLVRSPNERSLQYLSKVDSLLQQTNQFDINNCTHVLFLDPTSGHMPTRHVLQCIYVVVTHLLSETSPRTPAPDAITLLQQPIFDLLRGIFASNNAADKGLLFFSIRLWHLWITPWKPHSKGSLSSNTTTTKSRATLVKDAIKVVTDSNNTTGDIRRRDYADNWRPYVACNLHFYTTLFVFFVRTFSKRKLVENINGLYALESTLQIYSSTLVSALDVLCVGYLAQLSRTIQINFSDYIPPALEKNAREAIMNNSVPSLSHFEFDSISLQHRNLFPSMQEITSVIVNFRKELSEDGVNVIRSLATLAEVRNGIEENFISGVLGKLIPIFGMNEKKGDRFSRLKDMEVKLRTLLQIFVVIELTHPGSPSNRGDVMKKPLLNNEIAWFARLLVFISCRLNDYYNLPKDKSTVSLTWIEVLSRSSIGLKSYLSSLAKAFRINLRVFANVSMLCLSFWVIIFWIYQFAQLSEIWLAIFTAFASLPFLLSIVQDPVEVGAFDLPKTDAFKLDVSRERYHHGALTKEGREQLLAGKRICDKSSISFRFSPPPFFLSFPLLNSLIFFCFELTIIRGDVMLKPLRSDEFGFLVKYLVDISLDSSLLFFFFSFSIPSQVWISKYWNEVHNLPIDENSVHLTWTEILSTVPFSFHSYHAVIKSSFRINLRPLAHVRVLCFVIFWLLLLSHFLGFIGRLNLVVSLGLVGSLFWYGKFTGLLIWQNY